AVIGADEKVGNNHVVDVSGLEVFQELFAQTADGSAQVFRRRVPAIRLVVRQRRRHRQAGNTHGSALQESPPLHVRILLGLARSPALTVDRASIGAWQLRGQ